MAVYTQTDRARAFILGGSTEFPTGRTGTCLYFDAEDEVKISDPVQRMVPHSKGFCIHRRFPCSTGFII